MPEPKIPTYVFGVGLAAGVILAGPIVLFSFLIGGPTAGVLAVSIVLLVLISLYMVLFRRLE